MVEYTNLALNHGVNCHSTVSSYLSGEALFLYFLAKVEVIVQFESEKSCTLLCDDDLVAYSDLSSRNNSCDFHGASETSDTRLYRKAVCDMLLRSISSHTH